jgi:iron complex outermembrane receptor protein
VKGNKQIIMLAGDTAAKSMAMGVLCAVALNCAEAQERSESEGQQLQEVTVTAQFRKENIQDTPLAVTAVTAEMLEARGQTDMYQVAAQAPSVTLQPSGQGTGGANLVAFIRGIGQTDDTHSFEPGVGTYIDNVYLGTLTGSLLKLVDVDRVEVLRGPQGTLSGKNSIGGDIKVFSKSPSATDDAHLTVGYGKFNSVDVSAAGNFEVVPDVLYGRISGVGKTEDGWQHRLDYGCSHPGSGVPSFANGASCQLGTNGAERYAGARLAFKFTPTDWLTDNVSGDYIAQNNDPPAGRLLSVQSTPPNPPLIVPGYAPVPYDSRFVSPTRYQNFAGFCQYSGNLYGPWCAPDRVQIKIWGVTVSEETRSPTARMGTAHPRRKSCRRSRRMIRS